MIRSYGIAAVKHVRCSIREKRQNADADEHASLHPVPAKRPSLPGQLTVRVITEDEDTIDCSLQIMMLKE